MINTQHYLLLIEMVLQKLLMLAILKHILIKIHCIQAVYSMFNKLW